jgi:hypothetical protein
MSEANAGPKAEDSAAPSEEAAPEDVAKTAAPALSTAARSKDRWLAAGILGLAFALALVVSWQSGKAADKYHQLDE